MLAAGRPLLFDFVVVGSAWAAPILHSWYYKRKNWPLWVALFPPAGLVYWYLVLHKHWDASGERRR